jgi:hypothetical protein
MSIFYFSVDNIFNAEWRCSNPLVKEVMILITKAYEQIRSNEQAYRSAYAKIQG